MTSEEIILEVKDRYAEYLEMSQNPDALVSGILAKKVVAQQEYIDYLKKRIEANGDNLRH